MMRRSRGGRKALSREILIDLYRTMLKIRRAELRVAEIYPTDKIQSPVHLSVGQEAVSAGVCRALRPEDHIYGTYRGHGLYIARGGALARMFAELYGKDTGCARGKGGSMHLTAPEVGLMGCSAIVGSSIPLAVGDALASQLQGRSRVAAAFFGDGGVDEGVFYESVNFALLKNLPVLFVLENNRYAIHSTVADRHRQTDLFRVGEGLGLAGARFDGNDAGRVYATTSEAAEKIRRGGQPVLLEYTTRRWYEHVGPGEDFDEAYRDRGEKAQALKEDPLLKAKAVLASRFGIGEKTLRKWEQQTLREVDEAVEFAQSSPFPEPQRLHADLFLERSPS